MYTPTIVNTITDMRADPIKVTINGSDIDIERAHSYSVLFQPNATLQKFTPHEQGFYDELEEINHALHSKKIERHIEKFFALGKPFHEFLFCEKAAWVFTLTTSYRYFDLALEAAKLHYRLHIKFLNPHEEAHAQEIGSSAHFLSTALKNTGKIAEAMIYASMMLKLRLASLRGKNPCSQEAINTAKNLLAELKVLQKASSPSFQAPLFVFLPKPPQCVPAKENNFDPMKDEQITNERNALMAAEQLANKEKADHLAEQKLQAKKEKQFEKKCVKLDKTINALLQSIIEIKNYMVRINGCAPVSIKIATDAKNKADAIVYDAKTKIEEIAEECAQLKNNHPSKAESLLISAKQLQLDFISTQKNLTDVYENFLKRHLKAQKEKYLSEEVARKSIEEPKHPVITSPVSFFSQTTTNHELQPPDAHAPKSWADIYLEPPS